MNNPIDLESDPAIIEAATLISQALSESPGLRLNNSGPSLAMVWAKLRDEVQQLICTESTKYKEERTLFKSTYKPAIAALAAYLTQGFGVPIASASALAGLALLLPVKITVSAWCQAIHDSKQDIKSHELAVLSAISTPRKTQPAPSDKK